ncbi:MAG: hypothetical protein RSC93_02725 [Erysipelotrichaceae bacterium]
MKNSTYLKPINTISAKLWVNTIEHTQSFYDGNFTFNRERIY